jgi:hypothetical protein
MLLVPEVILLNTLQNCLKLVRKDFEDQADETKTILYRILFGTGIERYDFFTQAKKVFLIKDDNPRYLDINLFFNAKRAAIPTWHITLPSEGEKNNSIGVSEGYQDTLFQQSPDVYYKAYNRRFSTKYNIIITSDNTNEVVLMFHFLKSVLISINAHLNLAGLQAPKISGGDININSELIPLGIFVRSIGLEFEYDTKAYEFFSKETLIFDSITPNSIPNPII